MSKEKQILQLGGNKGIPSVKLPAFYPYPEIPFLWYWQQQNDNILLPRQPVQMKPNFEQIHKELLRAGVTLKLLWEEYTDNCRQAKQSPYMYSQFCKLYSDYCQQSCQIVALLHATLFPEST